VVFEKQQPSQDVEKTMNNADREAQHLVNLGITESIDDLFARAADQPVVRAFLLALTELEAAEHQMLDQARRVTDVAARVTGYVHSGSSINPLGELQGAGSQFDVSCATLSAARKNIKTLAGLLPPAV